MHPNSVDLYAGLYGLVVVPQSFDLGHGAAISQTYAHFMAPFTMAFAPAPPGKPHPPPWKPAKGGIYIDVTAELYLPATTCVRQLDRMNTVWWITALLRLRTNNVATVPVVSSERFASIPAIEQEPHLWPMEIHTPRLFPEGSAPYTLDIADLDWLRKNWYEAATLLENEDFSLAFQAIDSSIWNHHAAFGLIAVWGALERLFSPSQTELSFRTSANIAAYLERPGRERHICFRKAKALYDSRSKAAHGSGEPNLMPYTESYAIARRVLLKMVESRRVPSKKELEAHLFGDAIGISESPAGPQ